MQTKSTRWAVVFGLSSLFFPGSCAHGSSVQRTAPASALTVGQAERIVHQFENRHSMPANTSPLYTPKNLDDVLEVLLLDETDLFAHSIRFAASEGSVRGKTLAGQLLVS